MVILGIDPGTATTGLGVIEYINGKMKMLDYGCIETSKDFNLATRLKQIGEDIDEIITLWNPAHIAIEELFFSKNVKTAMHVAHARGVIMQAFASRGYDIHEYKPQHIKEAVCGYGRAEKHQMQKMVQLILNLEALPKPDDAADALGIAICHASRINILRAQQPLAK